MAQEDEHLDDEKSAFDEMFLEHQISLSIQDISLARSYASKLKLCAQHLMQFHGDSWDLEMIAKVINKEQIPKANDYRNASLQMRVEELMESEHLTYEKAVRKVANRIHRGPEVVRKAITSANKET